MEKVFVLSLHSNSKVLFEDEAVDGSDLANSSGDGGALFDDEDSVTEGVAEEGSGIEDAENTKPSQHTGLQARFVSLNFLKIKDL